MVSNKPSLTQYRLLGSLLRTEYTRPGLALTKIRVGDGKGSFQTLKTTLFPYGHNYVIYGRGSWGSEEGLVQGEVRHLLSGTSETQTHSI